MKLHKRTIRIPAGKIIQLMTPAGRIVAEFHDDALYGMFVDGARRTVSIWCEDTCQYVVGSLDELVGAA